MNSVYMVLKNNITIPFTHTMYVEHRCRSKMDHYTFGKLYYLTIADFSQPCAFGWFSRGKGAFLVGGNGGNTAETNVGGGTKSKLLDLVQSFTQVFGGDYCACQLKLYFVSYNYVFNILTTNS